MSKSRHTSEPSQELVTLPLDSIVPYWRNPRRITDEAVNALVESITRYGYQQPIVVDSQNVIIIGHTRYTALRKMGWTEAPVVRTNLPAEKAKALRVLDNRTAEIASWDFEQLVSELDDLDADLMRVYFPEIGGISDEGVTVVEEEPDLSGWDEVDTRAEFVCPGCFHTFEIDVTREAVMSGRLEVKAK